jgi:hypothetical protein
MPTTTKQTIHCRLCNAEIIFDGIQRSQRTGKQIPLDPTTKQPHNCPNYQKQTTLADTNTTTAAATTITATTSSNEPRYVKCKMCNNDIYFEEGRKSDSGKLIPIARLTNKRHQCKYNPTSASAKQKQL